MSMNQAGKVEFFEYSYFSMRPFKKGYNFPIIHLDFSWKIKGFVNAMIPNMLRLMWITRFIPFLQSKDNYKDNFLCKLCFPKRISLPS